jgi:hypothetical protein
MEHHIKIKPHPPDYMMKEKKEEKNKRKKGGRNETHVGKNETHTGKNQTHAGRNETHAVAGADPPRRKKRRPSPTVDLRFFLLSRGLHPWLRPLFFDFFFLVNLAPVGLIF